MVHYGSYSFYRPHNRADTWYTGEILDEKTGVIYKPPSRTKQSFAAECDINNILKQFGKTGQLTHISSRAAQGVYRDLPDDVDFQTSLSIVQQGEAAFATLPSRVRNRFHNSPEEFLAFLADPANREEAIKLGLVIPDPLPSPVPPAPSTKDKNGSTDPTNGVQG